MNSTPDTVIPADDAATLQDPSRRSEKTQPPQNLHKRLLPH